LAKKKGNTLVACGKTLKQTAPGTYHSDVRLPASAIASAVLAAGFSAERRMAPTGVASGKKYSAAGIMTAIAFAESDGDPYAVHVNTSGSKDVGVFQINDVHGVGCARMNPGEAARLSYRIAAGVMAIFTPWTTYKNRAFLKHLEKAESAVQADPDAISNWDDFIAKLKDMGGGAAAYGNALDAGDKALDALDFIKDLFSGETVKAVAFVLGGGLLLLVAIVAWVKQSGIVPKIAGGLAS
jgi:hypothetical protein